MSQNPQIQTILAQNKQFEQARASNQITQAQYDLAMGYQNQQLNSLGYQQPQQMPYAGKEKPVTSLPTTPTPPQPNPNTWANDTSNPYGATSPQGQISQARTPEQAQEIIQQISTQEASTKAATLIGLPVSLGMKYDLTGVQLQAGQKVTGYNEVQMAGPLLPGQVRPTELLITTEAINPPVAAPKVAPKSLSQQIMDFGASITGGLNVRQKLPGAFLGANLAPGQEGKNPLSPVAGIVASGEAMVYSAPRIIIGTGAWVAGNMFGSKANVANTVIQTSFDRVIPQPPKTLSGELTATAMGQGTKGLQGVLKDPGFAFGTVVGDVTLAAAMNFGVTRITGGTLTSDLGKQIGKPISQRIGLENKLYDFQDKLNMDYRVSVELDEVYKPSFADALKSKVTGITAQRPALGTTVLPTVETVPKEGWVQQADFSNPKTIGYRQETGFLKNPSLNIIEKEPIDSIPNMIKGNPDKMATGMDLLDFGDAPKSSTFGLSVEPAITRAELVARVPLKAKLPLNFGLGSDFISESVWQQNLKSYSQGANEPLSFNKTPASFGEDSALSFKRPNYPALEVPISKVDVATARNTIPEVTQGMNIYGDNLDLIQITKPVTAQLNLPKAMQALAPETRSMFSGVPISLNILKQTTMQRAENDEITVLSYPSQSGLPSPQKLNEAFLAINPIAVTSKNDVFSSSTLKLPTFVNVPSLTEPVPGFPAATLKVPTPNITFGETRIPKTMPSQEPISIPKLGGFPIQEQPQAPRLKIPEPQIPAFKIPQPQQTKTYPEMPFPKYPSANNSKLSIPAFHLGGGSGEGGLGGSMRGTWYERKHPNKTPAAMLKTFGIGSQPTRKQTSAGIKLTGINLNAKTQLSKFNMGNMGFGKALKAPKMKLNSNSFNMNFGRKQTRKRHRS
jgi:hypothetical protein